MGGKSERFIMRLSTTELTDWKSQADGLSVSVAELVRLRMRRPDPIDAVSRTPVLPQPLETMRRNPAMKAVKPTADGSKLVAAVLPVTGTEFPARPVYLCGQEPGKGKR